jgi:phenylacetate-CoA ligase
MKLYSYIRDNKSLYSLSWKIANRLPDSWVFPREYYDVIKLLSAHDRGEDIDCHRRVRLAGILRTALQSVPYYRALEIGITPGDVTGETAEQALMEFPYLEKRAVMENPEAFISDRYIKDKLLIDTSGGSTGQGRKIYTTARQKFIELAFSHYEWKKCGWRPASRVIRMGSNAIKKKIEHPFSRLGDTLLISPYHVNKEWFSETYKKITEFKTEYFHTYPSCFFQLTQYLRENNLTIPTVKGILLYSEEIPHSWISIIKEVFNDAPILMNYGLSERTNFAWGAYQNSQITYKLVPVYGYSENRFDSFGYPEIIGTTYWNDVMPLIRYRTQDYGLIKDGYIECLQGRAQSFLITRDNQEIPGISIDLKKVHWNFIDKFQIVQNEIGKIELHIIPNKAFNNDIRQNILEDQNSKWGDYFDVQIILSETTYQTQRAKQPMIINNVQKKRE